MAKIMLLCMLLLGTLLLWVHSFSSAEFHSDEFTWAPLCPTSTSGKIPRLIPDPTNCRIAFVCNEGKPMRYFCLNGLVFNANDQECVSRKACTKEADELTAFTKCPATNGKDIVSFAHPTDCQMFYVCNHGTAHLKRCNSNLHYNPQLRVCDFAYRANCKARLLSLHP